LGEGAVIGATAIILTHGVCRIGPGLTCRVKPAWGAASEMFPQPDAVPYPGPRLCRAIRGVVAVADRVVVGGPKP
jgi:hypothetical protein